MQLFALPHVVVYELMEHFQVSELVILSFCSKKAHAIVKRFSKYTHDDMKILRGPHLGYALEFTGAWLYVVPKNSKNLDTSDLKTAHGFEYTFTSSEEMCTRSKRFFICCKNVVDGCQKMTNYVCDLLKTSVATIYIYEEKEMWMLGFVQQRQTQQLKNVNLLEPFRMTAKNYSSILSSNVTETLEFWTYTRRDYQFDEHLPPAKNLRISHGYWITIEHLLALQSQTVQLQNCFFTFQHMNLVMHSWVNGGLPNLKFLKFNARERYRKPENPVDPTIEYLNEEISYTWSHHEDVLKFDPLYSFHIRRNDNVVATIQLDGINFTMVVWPDLNDNRV